MKVILAGYNLDRTVIQELEKTAPPREDITPETLAASYARISRDSRPVDELRAIARAEVERARKSNRNIIFKMGHHSVAEHAVFNFDIIGVSRLALEEIEKFRLCSYTEKSQRYVTLRDDFVLPEEVKKARLEKIFVKTIKSQNSSYRRLYEKLKPYFFDTYPEMARDPKKHSLLKGWAKEDARYVISLATQGQLGMTLNARNLEFLLRRFASKKLSEIKTVHQRMYALAKKVAPSIILFTEANDFDEKTYQELESKAEKCFDKKHNNGDKEPVRLVFYTSDADSRLVAALLYTSTSLTYEACLGQAKRLSFAEQREFIKQAFQHMEFYDFVLREFEHIDLIFDLIVSASCFAQLKRHRMATLTCQKYRPELGVTIPPSILKVGESNNFLALIQETNEVYELLKKKLERGAEYILTNAHRRRVLLKVNARELYHISRLREDLTAQWDIRHMVGKMAQLAKDVMPLTCLLIGGKDDYSGIYERIFGRPPKIDPPKL